MTSPYGKGLFHKAIGQSASCVTPASTEDANGHERGIALVEELGLDSLQELRSANADALISAMIASDWASESRIVIDGDVLNEWPSDTFEDQRQAKIPLMLGFLADEDEQLFPINKTLTRRNSMGF